MRIDIALAFFLQTYGGECVYTQSVAERSDIVWYVLRICIYLRCEKHVTVFRSLLFLLQFYFRVVVVAVVAAFFLSFFMCSFIFVLLDWIFGEGWIGLSFGRVPFHVLLIWILEWTVECCGTKWMSTRYR